MNSLPTGSILSWLVAAAAALSPSMALLVGFAGTDWLLRWQAGEKRHHAPLTAAESRELLG